MPVTLPDLPYGKETHQLGFREFLPWVGIESIRQRQSLMQLWPTKGLPAFGDAGGYESG